MTLISKETLLKAPDSKNRDAFLFDMLRGIDKKLDIVIQLKVAVASCERQLAYVKGVGTTVSLLFLGLLAWLTRNS